MVEHQLVSVCVCVSVCAYVFVCACVHVFVCACVCACVCVYVALYVTKLYGSLLSFIIYSLLKIMELNFLKQVLIPQKIFQRLVNCISVVVLITLMFLYLQAFTNLTESILQEVSGY